MEASPDAPEERHSHRLLIALAVTSFLVNTVLVGGIVVLSASGTAREWTADQLDVVRETELRATAREAKDAALTARAWEKRKHELQQQPRADGAPGNGLAVFAEQPGNQQESGNPCQTLDHEGKIPAIVL